MKNKVFLWVGVFLLTSIFLSLPVLADSQGNTDTNNTIPIQIANPPSTLANPPPPLPSDITKITPPTAASTSINTQTTPQPVKPSPVNIQPPAVNTPPVSPPTIGSNPNMVDPSGAMGGSDAAAEAVLRNYSKAWYLSPWFISLMVLLLVIILLVVYSLVEGKTPKEEKETEMNVPNKKKKIKK